MKTAVHHSITNWEWYHEIHGTRSRLDTERSQGWSGVNAITGMRGKVDSKQPSPKSTFQKWNRYSALRILFALMKRFPADGQKNTTVN
jgi:hypothetical protein